MAKIALAAIVLVIVLLVALAGSSPEGGGCGVAEPARAQVDERSGGGRPDEAEMEF